MLTVDINLLAVLVGTIATMALGSIWYSPLMFSATWMRLINKRKEDLSDSGQAMLGMLIGALITNYVLAYVIGLNGDTNALMGIRTAILLWIGFVAATSIGTVLFEKRPLKLWWINTGFTLLALALSGAIIAAW